MILSVTTALLTLLAAPQTPDAALQGYDPVLLCEGVQHAGRADLALRHGRYVYHFASGGTRARFEVDPERWSIQWGGGCGRMGPLSGAADGSRWAVYDGRLYAFASDGCKSGFLSGPDRFIVPPPVTPTVEDQAADLGTYWMKRALEAHGGSEALERVASAVLVRDDDPSNGWSQHVELALAPAGDVRRTSAWTPVAESGGPITTKWILNPASPRDSFVDEGDAAFAVTSPDQLADIRRMALREPLTYLWNQDARLALYRGESTLGGAPAVDVLVVTGELQTTLHLDPESGRILGMTWRGRINDGVTRRVVERFTSSRDLGGLSLPEGRVVTVEGEEQESSYGAWTSIRLYSQALAPLARPEYAPEGGR